MSVIEDEVIIAPWVGPSCNKNSLSITLLSSNLELIENISDALTKVHSKGSYKWKLILHRAALLEEIVQQMEVTGNVSIDFVVLALDTNRPFCLSWAQRVLQQVHPDLRRRRVILINASGLPNNAMAIDADDLLSLQNEYDIDLLSANVYNEEEAKFLAQRLLKHLEVTVGVMTGMPNLNI